MADLIHPQIEAAAIVYGESLGEVWDNISEYRKEHLRRLVVKIIEAALAARQPSQGVEPGEWVTVKAAWLEKIKAAVNQVATLTPKADRYRVAVAIKQTIADVLAAPQPSRQALEPKAMGAFRLLLAACNRLDFESEEYDLPDGWGCGAAMEYWSEFRTALERAQEALTEVAVDKAPLTESADRLLDRVDEEVFFKPGAPAAQGGGHGE